MPYYHDFGEQLYSWIEADCPMQYRDQETQTSQPVLQDQTLAIVDISPPLHAPVDAPPLMPDPATVAVIEETHTNITSTIEEPVEIEEFFTTSSLQLKMPPAVLETPLESTSGLDQELLVELAKSPEVETDPMLCPADVSNWPQPIPADFDNPNAEPEVEPTDECVDPTLTPIYLKYPQEANHSSLYPTEGPDCASSQ